jgi:hypothetical protein
MSEKEKFSIEKRLAEQRPGRREYIQGRIVRLQGALKNCTPPLTVRDDSSLAWGFAASVGDASKMRFQTIVDEIATMQVLYRDTGYNDILQNDMKIVAEHMKKKYPNVPWKILWTIMREHFVPLAKIQAVLDTPEGRLVY